MAFLTDWAKQLIAHPRAALLVQQMKANIVILDGRIALISTFCGIVSPICLAILRLITNSNFVGCSTGRSAGLAPFNILSTYIAARRQI
jgi:hypothetical protein